MSINSFAKSFRQSFELGYKGKCVLQVACEGAFDHFILVDGDQVIFHRKETFGYDSEVERELSSLRKKFDSIELAIDYIIAKDYLSWRLLYIEKSFYERVISIYQSKNISIPEAIYDLRNNFHIINY
jgi:hypothetical protein